jgi:hypothetical protein
LISILPKRLSWWQRLKTGQVNSWVVQSWDGRSHVITWPSANLPQEEILIEAYETLAEFPYTDQGWIDAVALMSVVERRCRISAQVKWR